MYKNSQAFLLQVLNPLDAMCNRPRDDAICVSQLKNARPVDKGLLQQRPDVKIFLPFRFLFYRPEEVFQPQTYNRFLGKNVLMSVNDWFKSQKKKKTMLWLRLIFVQRRHGISRIIPRNVCLKKKIYARATHIACNIFSNFRNYKDYALYFVKYTLVTSAVFFLSSTRQLDLITRKIRTGLFWSKHTRCCKSTVYFFDWFDVSVKIIWFRNLFAKLYANFETCSHEYWRYYDLLRDVFAVAPTGDHVISLVDEISFTFPPAPPLSQIDDIPPEQFCNGDNRPADCGANCMCTHQVDIPYNAVVEVVLVDEGMSAIAMTVMLSLH